MRRLIAALCTLGLSVLGMFGANQGLLNNENSANTSIEIVTVEDIEYLIEDIEEYATDVEMAVNNDEQMNIDETTKEVEVTPVEINNANNKVATTTNTGNTRQQVTTPAATTPAKETVVSTPVATTPAKETVVNTPAATTPVKETVVNTPQVTTPASETVANTPQTPANQVANNNVANSNVNNTTNNPRAISNIDFSQCNSIDDVVRELQRNGFTNINRNNVTQIQGMNDILSMVQNNRINNNNNNRSVTQTPVTNNNRQQTVNRNTTTTNPTNNAPANTATPAPRPTSAPTPTTAPAAPANNTNNNAGISSFANQVLQLVNQERAKAGLSALTTTPELTAAANKRAQETAQSFSHTRPNGTSYSTVLREYNVQHNRSGENIATGQRTPQEVVTAWMNSPGHRANIMNGSFGKLGVGVYQAPNGTISWAQLFTN